MSRLATLLLPCLCLAGCLATHPERITVRRDPEDILRKKAAARLSYAEFLDDRKNDAQELEWDLGRPSRAERERAEQTGVAQAAEHLWSAVPQYAIRESLRDDAAAQKEIGELVASIKEDPWRDYEQDRRDTLYRDWGDRLTQHPPVIEPDTDGPPGWLGPKALPELPKLEPAGEGEGESEE